MREHSDIVWKNLHADALENVRKSVSYEQWQSFGYDDWENWRRDYTLAQRDLYFLCTDIFNLSLVEKTHRPITNFFIKKEPYLVGTSGWIDDISHQHTDKNRLLLFPRGTFKSSIDKIDIVQWIICFPNIRILVMTAEENLASSFLEDVRKHFIIETEGSTKEKNLRVKSMTRFQMLFSKHCFLSSVRTAEGVFTTRARTEKLDQPTLQALSIGMNTSGIHVDVGKFDDCVSNDNSGPTSSEDARKSVGEQLILARPIVSPYGYRDYIGTPYSDDDGYAILQEKLPKLKILKEACWTVRKSGTAKKIEDFTADDVELQFPADSQGVERNSFDKLMTEFYASEYIFACQFLLDPRKASIARFTEDLLRSHVCPAEGLPQQHKDYAVFDLAYSVEDKRDYTVGGVVWVDEEHARGFITKLIRGRFSKGELPYQIAKLASDWKVIKIAIEDSPGAQYLDDAIRFELTKLNYGECPIEYIKVDTQKNAKNARAEGVENLLNQDRLYFSADLGDMLDTLVREFCRFKPGSKRKDDIVDTVGHCARFIPANPQPVLSTVQLQQRAWQIHEIKDEHDRIWNTAEWMANAPINLRQPVQNFQNLPTEFDGYPLACSFCGQARCICK